MSKVLIDRELLETLLVQHVAGLGYTNTAAHYAQKALDAPSGTPAMPVKAYYHEAPNEYGGFNKSVGLEVRKEFTDAPLVLESDALARIAGLEGEIAKRDEELAACRVAVENCEVFRARIAELQRAEKNDAIAYKAALERQDELRAELAAIKAQAPVTNDESGLEAWAAGKFGVGGAFRGELCGNTDWALARLVWSAALAYAAPVSEAKAQGVVMPEPDIKTGHGYPAYSVAAVTELFARLKAAPVQPPKCKTCDDNGRIGGPSFYAPDDGGEPCPDCSAPVQQVSVPDEREAFEKWGETLFFSACFERHGSDEYAGRGLQGAWLGWQARAMLAAAPAAPAADAGGVLEQAMYALISIGYHENSGLVHELRQTLAAHRTQGAV